MPLHTLGGPGSIDVAFMTHRRLSDVPNTCTCSRAAHSHEVSCQVVYNMTLECFIAHTAPYLHEPGLHGLSPGSPPM